MWRDSLIKYCLSTIRVAWSSLNSYHMFFITIVKIQDLKDKKNFLLYFFYAML